MKHLQSQGHYDPRHADAIMSRAAASAARAAASAQGGGADGSRGASLRFTDDRARQIHFLRSSSDTDCNIISLARSSTLARAAKGARSFVQNSWGAPSQLPNRTDLAAIRLPCPL